MIEVFFYSIAGKKNNESINIIINDLIDSPNTPQNDLNVLKYTRTVAENGNYPSKDYYKDYYQDKGIVYKSLAEIVAYAKKVKEFFAIQAIQRGVFSAINTSNDLPTLVDSISKVISQDVDTDDDTLDEYMTKSYKESKVGVQTEGYKIGVPEIDALTNGLQPATVSSIAGFVAEGKSTFGESILYKNALDGKKCVFVSIELAPELVTSCFRARYMYEVHGVQVTTSDLIQHKLTKEQDAAIEEHDDQFMEELMSNMIILDEAFFSKQDLLDPKRMAMKFKRIEKRLGGIDLVLWDHIGQLELMFPDCGNQIIRNITSVTKTYKTENDTKFHTIILAQTNREGRKRASRRDGLYDLQALSDLNEIERSSTYCIFIYTTEDSKIVQETKVMMLKHRLGTTLAVPTVTTFNPSIALVGSNVQEIVASESFASDLLGADFEDISF